MAPLLSAAEELPLRAASLDLVTAFNCVHHFDLGRFLAAAARVLRPGGQLFIYTRTPQQNARTIWGRYFPGFTEHEQRLHSQAAIRDAVRRTRGLTVIATQIFKHPRSSTAGRLQAQAEGRHYSTFSLYPPEELRAAIATFLARLPGDLGGGWLRLYRWVDGVPIDPARPDPAGRVTFYRNGTAVGSEPLTPQSSGGSAATLTTTARTSTDQFVAVYSGDGTYTPTTSNTTPNTPSTSG